MVFATGNGIFLPPVNMPPFKLPKSAACDVFVFAVETVWSQVSYVARDDAEFLILLPHGPTIVTASTTPGPL